MVNPRGPGRAGLMAADALAITGLGQFDFRIVNVRLGGPVAGFAGKAFVLRLGQFLDDLAVAGVAGFAPGPERFAAGDLLEGRAAVVAVLAERLRRQQVARGKISADDCNSQQDEPGDLRRHA